MWIDKVLCATGCFFLVAVLGILCVASPATGYELSIYSAYPLYLWIFFIVAISCGIGVLVHQALTPEESKWWIAGLLLVISANSIFLLLPIFRGYAIYGQGDTLSHMGYMKDILSSGHIGEGNYYPMFHLLGASLIQVTGLPPGVTVNGLAAFFSIVYITNMYLLAMAISKSQKGAILLVAFASPLVFLGSQARPFPNYVGVVMLPLVLYFLHRVVFSQEHRQKNTIIMILVLIFIVFVHPATAVFAVVIVVIFGAAAVIYPILVGREDGLTSGRRRIAALVSLNIGVGMLTLLLLSSVTGAYAGRAIQGFATNAGSALSARLSLVPPSSSDYHLSLAGLDFLKMARSDASWPEVLGVVVGQYGSILLFLTVACVAALVVLAWAIIRARGSSPVHFTYGVIFIVIGVMTGFLLFVYSPEGGVVRVLRIQLFAGAVIAGLATYELAARFAGKPNARGLSMRRSSCVAVITLFLAVVATLSAGAVHLSPRVWSYNMQVTHASLAGGRWLVETRDSSVPIAAFVPDYIRRLEDYSLGVAHRRRDRPLPIERLPTHFGYDEHGSVGEVFDYADMYIAVLPVDPVVSSAHLVDTWYARGFRYAADDIASLRNDVTASHIYSGGQFEIWLAHL